MVDQPTNNQPTDVDVIFIQPDIEIVRYHKVENEDAVVVWFEMNDKQFVVYAKCHHRDYWGAYCEWARGAVTP